MSDTDTVTATKKQQAQAAKNTATLAKATGLDLTKSLSRLTESGILVQRDLSRIGEELIQKHAELQAVDDAIALKRQELETLHGADQILMSLDELNESYRLEMERLDKEKSTREEEDLEDRRQREIELDRERAEYEYNLAQSRKVEVDQWNEMLRVRSIVERDRKEAFEKDLAAREAVLKLKETEYKAALDKAASFDVELKKAVDKEAAIITNSLKREHQHQTELANVQNQAAISGLTAKIATLVEAVGHSDAIITSLQGQLKESQAAQTQLAKDAVAAASNQKATAEAMAVFTATGGNNGAQRPRG
jgi:hypothetical protein